MAKKKFKPLNLLLWVVGILVTLAVAFGLVGGSLTIPYIPSIVTVVAGWVVVSVTALGILTKLLGK